MAPSIRPAVDTLGHLVRRLRALGGESVRKPDGWADMNDNQRVRALIDRAKVSQVQMAKAIGIDPRTMRRYCSPGYKVPKGVLLALEAVANGAVK